jgi:uncharacterized iron-regulated protein
MRRWLAAGLISTPLLLCSGTVQPAEPAPTAALADFASYSVARVDRTGLTRISLEQAGDLLKDYDVVFVGEFHDHIANHLAELGLLSALHQRVPMLALSMEQFERDRQSRLDDYLAGKIGEETLTRGLGWKNYEEAYRPLVEYAKDNHLPVIAANAPLDIVRCVAREGIAYLSGLPAAKRRLAADDIHTADGPYKQKFLRFSGTDAAHGGSGMPDGKAKQRMENNFAAQMTRDDTMADSIANFLRANPGYHVLHVAGAFHLADRLGTVESLRMRSPDLKIALVMPVQTSAEAPMSMPDDAGQADLAILMRREPEPYVTDAERKAAEAAEAKSFQAAQNISCR